ncbi:ABC transporter ATP-binding protein [Inhella gelatinilytica]|uniref:ABC transporter ATP-binding protein n=1 Tax=Inhella gelatinilytica TaxID=2795030 RepID=A0A931J1A0_9BURK|nr:ABC transporter ATP-binding protein [Inhella gelatinilytica]MBH9553673.1 ABC transporter ATP-binding protein [Inhella gelatinilytica]
MNPVLHAQHLCKNYGNRPAVQNLSLTVRPGELLALLGPNGAGKSSTIGMISGLLPPDSGSIRIAGVDLVTTPDAAKRRIGLVPQDLALFEDLPARTNLMLFGALYGLDRPTARNRADVVLAQVGLADRVSDKPAAFSGGMKRRLNIACALMHEPELLLLDEPTAGVDPQSRQAIFELIEQLKRSGKAVVYTTHYMEEAERLADRIVIVDHGHIVAEGTLHELLARLPAAQKVSLTLSEPLAGNALQALHDALPSGASLTTRGPQLCLAMADLTRGLAALLPALTAHGVAVINLHSGRASLEDVFLTLTGRQLRDPGAAA